VYRGADIFVMPMWGEGGSPDSIKEALAAGTPSVVTRVPGIAEQLRDGREVVFVDARSPEALADGVQRLIEDPELRRTVALGGWDWAQDVTVERAIAQMLDHLRPLVAEREGRTA
jgi:glycosyltransferase involved in cell wall biosynthesis